MNPEELIKAASRLTHVPDGLACDEPGHPGGLIPWSNNEHHETFFWITEGSDPDLWPVYAVTETEEGSRFECTAAEFLFRQMTDSTFLFYSAAEHITGHWFMRFIRPHPNEA